MVIESVALAAATAAGKAAGTSATTALFKAATERAERSNKGAAKSILIKALASLQTYSAYLQETNDRVSTFKTFADPTKPVKLLDHFVGVKLQIGRGKATINQDELISRLRRPSRFVISATAGFGKSMVMRYIALALFENPMGKIPLFLELRNLNRVTNPDIINFLHSSYRQTGEVQLESFRKGLEGGTFVLILDGFDELNHELRKSIEEQIINIGRTYKDCSIVISGRPDDRFKAWASFSLLKVAPMEKKQIIELINKLDYDNGVRRRFIQKIKNGLYESHDSFLSTPLLAILMLLTFEQNANIPDKMYLFYGEAFKTLFHKHDALKEQYDRSRKSSLVVDEFEKVFSVFCLKTYVQEKTEFVYNEIIGSIKDALRYENRSVSPEDFLFDIEEAVCLLMKEGPSYFFVHRSFQEYFTAVFLATCAETIRDEFIDHVSTRYWDNVLPMLFDMASAQIEPTWVAKNCGEYLHKVGFDAPKTRPLLARFESITLWKQGGSVRISSFTFGPFHRFINIMMKFYPIITEFSDLNFDPIEDWVRLNWEGLSLEYKVTTGQDENLMLIAIPFDRIPEEVLNPSGFDALCEYEYRQIDIIAKNLNNDQGAKNAFLENLFLTSKNSDH